MKEFKIKSSKETFRIKKMNAIEVLSLRTIIDYDNVDNAIKSFSTMLERIEVKVDDNWLPVKSGKNFHPVSMEDDVIATQELCVYFVNEYLKPLFTKSETSNSEQQ